MQRMKYEGAVYRVINRATTGADVFGHDTAKAAAKGAPWKVTLAAAMKATTTASNPWLVRRLNLGSPFRLSRLVSACRANPALLQPEMSMSAKCKV